MIGKQEFLWRRLEAVDRRHLPWEGGDMIPSLPSTPWCLTEEQHFQEATSEDLSGSVFQLVPPVGPKVKEIRSSSTHRRMLMSCPSVLKESGAVISVEL